MNKKQLQLVSFEQAKRLKELGFDWITEYKHARHSYAHSDRSGFSIMKWGVFDVPNEMNCALPSVALALKWIRDVRKIENSVCFFDVITQGYEGCYNSTRNVVRLRRHYTYEAAESALLDELLTILENQS